MKIRSVLDFMGITRPSRGRSNLPPIVYLIGAVFSLVWVFVGLIGPWPTWFAVLWIVLMIVFLAEWLWLRNPKRPRRS